MLKPARTSRIPVETHFPALPGILALILIIRFSTAIAMIIKRGIIAPLERFREGF